LAAGFFFAAAFFFAGFFFFLAVARSTMAAARSLQVPRQL
jgi:hypothetical protein